MQQENIEGVEGTDEFGNIVADSQVPIEVSEDKLEELSRYLMEEIREAESNQSNLEGNIERWSEIYEAKAPESKTFPWPGCSNIIVPTVAIAVDAFFARVMNAIFGAKEIYVTSAKSPEWVKIAPAIERFLNWVSTDVMKMQKHFSTFLLGLIKYGTGIVKLDWERRIRYMVTRDPQSGAVVKEPVKLYDAPRLTVIPLQDFFVSSDALSSQDLQKCSWVGYRSYYTWKDLKDMESSGIFQEVDRIKAFERSTVSGVEQIAQEATGYEVVRPHDYEIFEIYLSFPLDQGDEEEADQGILYELIINIEKESGTILRAVYNFFQHQERPIHMARCMPRESSIFGIGLAQMLEDIQREITGIHNRRNDNATIANTRAWKKRNGSMLTSEDVFPGAMVPVNEMDDVSELRLGDIYPSQLQEEMHTNAIGEKRSGISDYSVGRESSAIGSRATATSTMAIIREGNQRFKLTIDEIKDVMGDLGHQILMLYQQFSDDELMYEIFSEKEKRYVQEYFAMPTERTRTKIHLDTPALSEVTNKEMNQQIMMTLMGVVEQFYKGLFDAVGVIGHPEAPPMMKQLAVQAAQSGSEIFKRLLHAFDFADADSFAPDIEELLGGMDGQGMEAPIGPEGVQGSQGDGVPGGQPDVGAGGAGGPESLGFTPQQMAELAGLGSGAGAGQGSGL